MKETLDFIIIGAQKAGTSSLFEYFRSHPELWMPPSKEAPYFSHNRMLEQGWASYLAKTFALADPNCKWGTATPSYMVGGIYEPADTHAEGNEGDERTIPLRILERLPDVRLIAVLRDPVARARSHHQMAVMTGRETRAFDDVIQKLLEPNAIKDAREFPRETNGYVAWGEYGRILSGYFDVFPREQICVVFTDELEQAPGRVMERLQEYLGVATDYVPSNLGERYRTGASGRRIAWLKPDVVQEAAARMSFARSLWHLLPEDGRRRADQAFRGASYRLDLWNRQSGAYREVPQPATLRSLRDHFLPDTEMLTSLLGVAPPWRSMSIHA